MARKLSPTEIEDVLAKIALSKLYSDDHEMIVELAGRLDWSPKKNWVENEGGLPKYIEDVALALIRGGMSRQRAIATAISQIKKWIASPNTKPETKAKAIAAIASWERLKKSAAARRKAKS